ncbi:MAG TPA: phage shock protein PspA [Azospirillaceae bacterium]|nr:phage shock protein PspA [Azospirillaceae bacterium]
MSIFSRLGDIVDANLNAMLDRAEDPEKLIGMVIQEMEDTLVEVRSATVRAMAQRKELTGRYRAYELEMLDWERKAELALTKGREDLARAALVARSRIKEAGAPIEQDLAAIDLALSRNAEDVSRLEAKLNDARSRQRALLARHVTATARLRVRTQLHDGRIDEALSRFDDLHRELDQLEGRAEVLDMGRGPRGLAAEFASLENDDKVTAELEALKSRMAAR